MTIKLRLFHKLFLANLSVLILLFIALMTMNYINHSAVSEYINQATQKEEQAVVISLSHHLAQYYDRSHSWQMLVNDKQFWQQYIEGIITDELLAMAPPKPAMPDHLPPPHFDKFFDDKKPPENAQPVFQPDQLPPQNFEQPPVSDHKFRLPVEIKAANIASRISLLSVDNQPLIKSQTTLAQPMQFSVPITQNNQVIGQLNLVKADNSSLAIDQILPSSQFHNIFWLTLCGILLAAMVSFFVTKHLAAPINQLMAGSVALAQRQFRQKILINSNDELAELAQQFNNIGKQLANYEQQQKQWLQDIAHELRTPLTIMRSDVEAMVDGVMPANEENLALLKSDILRLNRLINDLHELSVTDQLQLNNQTETINIAELLEQQVKRFQPAFNQQNKQLMGDFQALSIGVISIDSRK
ncbi:histidine kinase dimerization/phospho-acceptor domain-containing protein [Colwellia sp. MEBiC06753]